MNRIGAAFRSLARSRGYTALAIITLAVGIASSASVFSLLDAFYFRPIPLRDPFMLEHVRLASPKTVGGMFSYTEYRRISENVPDLHDTIAIGRRGVTFRQSEQSELRIIHYVSGNYFDGLGIPMYLGRGLSPADDRPDAVTPNVVINYQFWVERLGGRKDVINSPVRLNDTEFTVVGVTAPGFLGLDRVQRTDFWVAVAQVRFVLPGLEASVDAPYSRWFEVIGRVKPEGRSSLAAQLKTVLSNLKVDNAEQYNGATIEARNFMDDDREGRSQGAVFLGLVVLVLLVASANVANVTLARGESRHRDIAVRAALGASRFQLVAESLREAMALSLLAGLAGLLLATWLVALFPALVPHGIGGMVIDVRTDVRWFAFGGLLIVLTFLLVGPLPAWRSTRGDVWSEIKRESTGSAPGAARFGIRDFLVLAQIALSVMVLMAAGMLVRSLAYGRNVSTGFDTRKNLATFYVASGSGYDNPATYRLFESARVRLASLPGVRRVSYAIRLPAQENESGWAQDFTIPGKELPAGEQFFRIKYTMVGPNYFPTLGTQILQGRGIDESDLPNGRRVAVVNQTMARRFWPNEAPVGKTIMVGREKPAPLEIVGVAEDGKVSSLYESAQPYVYVPYAQDPQGFGLLLVETEANPTSVLAAGRRKIAEIDPDLRILDSSSLADYMAFILFDERRDAIVAMSLGLLSLALSTVGVYAVVSLIVSRQAREIGIRIALGSSRSKVLQLVVGRIELIAAVGVAAGLAGGLVAGRLLQARLHGVPALDPISMITAAVAFTIAAALAAMVPSWRAARIDPIESLRHI